MRLKCGGMGMTFKMYAIIAIACNRVCFHHKTVLAKQQLNALKHVFFGFDVKVGALSDGVDRYNEY